MKKIRASCLLITRRDANRGEDAGERGEIKRKEKDRRGAEVSEDAANHADGREWGEFAKKGMDNPPSAMGAAERCRSRVGSPRLQVRGTPPTEKS